MTGPGVAFSCSGEACPDTYIWPTPGPTLGPVWEKNLSPILRTQRSCTCARGGLDLVIQLPALEGAPLVLA